MAALVVPVVVVDNPGVGCKGSLKVAGARHERSPRDKLAVIVDPRHLYDIARPRPNQKERIHRHQRRAGNCG